MCAKKNRLVLFAQSGVLENESNDMRSIDKFTRNNPVKKSLSLIKWRRRRIRSPR